MGLRSRLLALVVLGLAPVVALLLWLLAAERTQELGHAGRNALLLTKVGAESHANLIREARGLLETLSHVPAVRKADPDACADILSGVGQAHPWTTGFWVADPSGRTVCIGEGTAGRSSFIGDRAYFQEALRSRAFTLSGYTIGRTSKRPLVVAVLPLLDSRGDVESMLLTSIDLSVVNSQPPVVQGHDLGGNLLAVDAAGVVLLQRPNGPAAVGQSIAGHPLFTAIRSAPEGVVDIAGVDGVPRVYGFTRLAGTEITLAIGFSKDVILAESDQALMLSLAALCLTVITSIAGAWLFLERAVLRWVSRLRGAAERISGGDLSTTVEVPRTAGELGDLANAFNRMSGELQRREDQIREAYAGMEIQALKLAETAEHLRSANRRAEAANAAKSDFLATISHELRTPLNGVIGFSELLLDTALTADQRTWVSLQREAGQGLLALINDILDFARIEAGRLELSERAFDMRGLLQGCAALVESSASTKGLRLEIAIADAVPAGVMGDDVRVRQVILNLLSNAIKFTETGGVTMTAGAAVMGDGATRVRVSVTDTGIGITADKQAQLFRKFEQVDSSITRRYGGAGLGLAISKRLVEMMGGTIGVESTVGRGSTFWFEIPLRSVSLEASKRVAASVIAARPGRILIAEDVKVNQLLATTLLRGAGHTVDAVSNGAEAVEAVMAKAYDLVLMDLQMPVMDGYEATQRIRALAGSKAQVPIVALTANAQAEQLQRCLDCGMNNHLVKPIDRDGLFRVIARHLGTLEVAPATPPVRSRLLEELSRVVGEDGLADMVRLFRDDVRERLTRMEHEPGDTGVVGFQAHAIKSAAESLGLAEVATAARTVSDRCRAGGAPDMATQVAALRDAVERALAEMETALAAPV